MKLLYTFNKNAYPETSKIILPMGVKKIKIKSNGGSTISELGYIIDSAINNSHSIEFPIINGKSPNTFTIGYWSESTTFIEIFVEEIGGIPDPNYFSDTPTVTSEIITGEPTAQEVKKDAI